MRRSAAQIDNLVATATKRPLRAAKTIEMLVESEALFVPRATPNTASHAAASVLQADGRHALDGPKLSDRDAIEAAVGLEFLEGVLCQVNSAGPGFRRSTRPANKGDLPCAACRRTLR